MTSASSLIAALGTPLNVSTSREGSALIAALGAPLNVSASREGGALIAALSAPLAPLAPRVRLLDSAQCALVQSQLALQNQHKMTLATPDGKQSVEESFSFETRTLLCYLLSTLRGAGLKVERAGLKGEIVSSIHAKKAPDGAPPLRLFFEMANPLEAAKLKEVLLTSLIYLAGIAQLFSDKQYRRAERTLAIESDLPAWKLIEKSALSHELISDTSILFCFNHLRIEFSYNQPPFSSADATAIALDMAEIANPRAALKNIAFVTMAPYTLAESMRLTASHRFDIAPKESLSTHPNGLFHYCHLITRRLFPPCESSELFERELCKPWQDLNAIEKELRRQLASFYPQDKVQLVHFLLNFENACRRGLPLDRAGELRLLIGKLLCEILEVKDQPAYAFELCRGYLFFLYQEKGFLLAPNPGSASLTPYGNNRHLLSSERFGLLIEFSLADSESLHKLAQGELDNAPLSSSLLKLFPLNQKVALTAFLTAQSKRVAEEERTKNPFNDFCWIFKHVPPKSDAEVIQAIRGLAALLNSDFALIKKLDEPALAYLKKCILELIGRGLSCKAELAQLAATQLLEKVKAHPELLTPELATPLLFKAVTQLQQIALLQQRALHLFQGVLAEKTFRSSEAMIKISFKAAIDMHLTSHPAVQQRGVELYQKLPFTEKRGKEFLQQLIQACKDNPGKAQSLEGLVVALVKSAKKERSFLRTLPALCKSCAELQTVVSSVLLRGAPPAPAVNKPLPAPLPPAAPEEPPAAAANGKETVLPLLKLKMSQLKELDGPGFEVCSSLLCLAAKNRFLHNLDSVEDFKLIATQAIKAGFNGCYLFVDKLLTQLSEAFTNNFQTQLLLHFKAAEILCQAHAQSASPVAFEYAVTYLEVVVEKANRKKKLSNQFDILISGILPVAFQAAFQLIGTVLTPFQQEGPDLQNGVAEKFRKLCLLLQNNVPNTPLAMTSSSLVSLQTTITRYLLHSKDAANKAALAPIDGWLTSICARLKAEESAPGQDPAKSEFSSPELAARHALMQYSRELTSLALMNIELAATHQTLNELSAPLFKKIIDCFDSYIHEKLIESLTEFCEQEFKRLADYADKLRPHLCAVAHFHIQLMLVRLHRIVEKDEKNKIEILAINKALCGHIRSGFMAPEQFLLNWEILVPIILAFPNSAPLLDECYNSFVALYDNNHHVLASASATLIKQVILHFIALDKAKLAESLFVFAAFVKIAVTHTLRHLEYFEKHVEKPLMVRFYHLAYNVLKEAQEWLSSLPKELGRSLQEVYKACCVELVKLSSALISHNSAVMFQRRTPQGQLAAKKRLMQCLSFVREAMTKEEFLRLSTLLLSHPVFSKVVLPAARAAVVKSGEQKAVANGAAPQSDALERIKGAILSPDHLLETLKILSLLNQKNSAVFSLVINAPGVKFSDRVIEFLSDLEPFSAMEEVVRTINLHLQSEKEKQLALIRGVKEPILAYFTFMTVLQKAVLGCAANHHPDQDARSFGLTTLVDNFIVDFQGPYFEQSNKLILLNAQVDLFLSHISIARIGWLKEFFHQVMSAIKNESLNFKVGTISVFAGQLLSRLSEKQITTKSSKEADLEFLIRILLLLDFLGELNDERSALAREILMPKDFGDMLLERISHVVKSLVTLKRKQPALDFAKLLQELRETLVRLCTHFHLVEEVSLPKLKRELYEIRDFFLEIYPDQAAVFAALIASFKPPQANAKK
jgi:hypothetical protein